MIILQHINLLEVVHDRITIRLRCSNTPRIVGASSKPPHTLGDNGVELRVVPSEVSQDRQPLGGFACVFKQPVMQWLPSPGLLSHFLEPYVCLVMSLHLRAKGTLCL